MDDLLDFASERTLPTSRTQQPLGGSTRNTAPQKPKDVFQDLLGETGLEKKAPLAPADSAWNFDLLAQQKPGAQQKGGTGTSSLLDDDWGMGPDVASNFGTPGLMASPATTSQMNFLDADLSSTKGSHRDFDDGLARPHIKQASTSMTHPDDLMSMFETVSVSDARKPDIPKPADSSKRNTEPSSHRSAGGPPPHIVGLLVEMGFPVAESLEALEQSLTDRGKYDANYAADILSALVEDPVQEVHRHDIPRHEAAHREASRHERSRDPAPSTAHNGSVPQSSTGQRQEVLASAQKFGLSMWKNASAYLNQGRDHLNKVLEDSQLDSLDKVRNTVRDRVLNQRSAVSDGRPRWMAESQWHEASSMHNGENGFQEMLNGSAVQPSRVMHSEPTLSPSAGPTLSRSAKPVSSRSAEPTPSRFTGPTPSRPTGPTPSRSTGPPPPTSAPPVTHRVYEKPVTQRKVQPRLTTQSSEFPALETVINVKQHGNEAFRIGQYGRAIEFYTEALRETPETHLVAVPLYNNRANAHLKNGQARDAAADATSVLCLLADHAPTDKFMSSEDLVLQIKDKPIDEEALPKDGRFKTFDHLGKALMRRALAFETLEKYADALADWLTLRGITAALPGIGGISVVTQGISRCRTAIEPKKNAPRATRATPAANLGAPSSTQDSKAVQRMRSVQDKQKAEEEEKLALKDKVEQKVNAWSGGSRKGNLRALIASLDQILWPELNWKPIGLHEMLTDSQLKVKYMKSIASVHPDKLRPETTSLENRLIGAHVFSILNDTWNAR